MGRARFTEPHRSSLWKRSYKLWDSGHVSRKSSIGKGSYLSYDFGVLPKKEKGKKGKEGRKEEREGGERQRSVWTTWFKVATVLIEEVRENLASRLAEHGFLGKEVNHGKITRTIWTIDASKCGVLKCVSISF